MRSRAPWEEEAAGAKVLRQKCVPCVFIKMNKSSYGWSITSERQWVGEMIREWIA